MSREISFKTIESPSTMGGGEGKCRCSVIHKDVLSPDDIARDMAAMMRLDVVEARHCADVVATYIVRALSAGRRLNFGAFSLSLSIRGAVDGANGEFVPGVNSVCVNIQAGTELKEALGKLHPVNITDAGKEAPRITSVVDTATHAENTLSPGAKTLVAGAGLLVNTSAADEGVWLEAGGRRVMRGVVTASSATTLDCVFGGGLEPGEYRLAVYTRCGDPTRQTPARVRRKVLLL